MAGRDRLSTLGRVWTLAAAFVLGPAGPGHADLVHPVPFDATITVDTETGLEWLDLTETVGLSYAQVEAGAGGYVADGWRHATVHEVCDLFERYLVPTNPPPRSCPATQFDFPTPVTFSSQVMFIAYLGSTNFSYGGSGGGLAGLTDGSIPPDFAVVTYDPPGYYSANVATSLTVNTTNPTVGHFLVRMPSPGVPALPGLGVALLSSLLASIGALGIRARARKLHGGPRE